MTLTIGLPDELGAALQAHAHAKGVSPDQYVRQILEVIPGKIRNGSFH